jgi:hypothetical protein
MEESVKKDIITILRKTIPIIKEENVTALKELSNHTIHDASIFQDKDSILIAIIIYSLSKIIARSEGRTDDWDKVKDETIKEVERAETFLTNDREEDYRSKIKKLLRNIGKLDKMLSFYIEDIFEKARIIKGAKLYEHGLSIGRAADFLGISQWELMSYVGKTKIVDKYEEEVIPITIRLDHAKKIFRLK